MHTIKSIEKEIIPILRSHQVKRASLFGSIVRGNMNENSDIDILVEMPEKASLLDRVKIKVAIEKKLGIPADVLRFDTIRKHARDSILATQIPIQL